MKDAKGHGSNGRGGDAQSAARFQARLGSFNRDGSPITGYGGVQDNGAAHQAGVVAATTGVNLRVQASENPAVGQDYQERTYRYNGSNRKAAVNWALKKAHAEFPNHRSHSVEVME